LVKAPAFFKFSFCFLSLKEPKRLRCPVKAAFIAIIIIRVPAAAFRARRFALNNHSSAPISQKNKGDGGNYEQTD